MADSAPVLLNVEGLCKNYHQPDKTLIRAVADVSFKLAQGEVLGVVGESGCGKSTLGKVLLRLVEPSAGSVKFFGRELQELSREEMKSIRKDLQIVFQDPFGSLNPRHKVGTILAEPLKVHNIGHQEARAIRVRELLGLVGLPENAAQRYPHEFSGGQRQRIAIARALALNPKFLVADEAVSALDVSVQSQIINLLIKLQRQFGIALLFISHDLSVIRHVSDRVAVMYLGRIVETGTVDEVLNSPKHPYTHALVSAVPDPTRNKAERVVLTGDVPDPANPPSGCPFNSRCPVLKSTPHSELTSRCRTEPPAFVSRRLSEPGGDQRKLACHLFTPV